MGDSDVGDFMMISDIGDIIIILAFFFHYVGDFLNVNFFNVY